MLEEEESRSVNLDFSDKIEIEKWCQILNCEEDVLRFCATHVGNSIVSIEAFLNMNRDWISLKL